MRGRYMRPFFVSKASWFSESEPRFPYAKYWIGKFEITVLFLSMHYIGRRCSCLGFFAIQDNFQFQIIVCFETRITLTPKWLCAFRRRKSMSSCNPKIWITFGNRSPCVFIDLFDKSTLASRICLILNGKTKWLSRNIRVKIGLLSRNNPVWKGCLSRNLSFDSGIGPVPLSENDKCGYHAALPLKNISALWRFVLFAIAFISNESTPNPMPDCSRIFCRTWLTAPRVF